MSSHVSRALSCSFAAALLTACGGGGGGDIVIETFDIYDARNEANRVDTTYEGEIALLVPRGDGYEVHDDAEITLGSVVFRDVPGGRYYIAYRRPGQTPFFVETSERRRTLSSEHVGRQAWEADEATAIDLSVTFAEPWVSSNMIELFSEFAYMDRRGRASIAAHQDAPMGGETSAENWIIPLDALSDPYDQFVPLVDADLGDDLSVFVSGVVQPNLALDDANPWHLFAYRTVSSMFDATGATFENGGVTSIGGTFVPVEPTMVTLDLRTTAFEARLGEGFGDAPASFRVWLEAHAEPVLGDDNVLVGHGGRLFDTTTSIISFDDGEGNVTHPPDIVQAIRYGNPFGEGRIDLASVFVYAWFDIADPVDGELESIEVRYSVYRRLDALVSGPITPALGLPREISVDDQPAPVGASISGVGLTPRISWRAPEEGEVTSYALEIIDTANIEEDGELIGSRSVARADVTSTSFVVPEGLLVSGRYYYVRIAAIDADGEVAKTFAQTASGFFQP